MAATVRMWGSALLMSALAGVAAAQPPTGVAPRDPTHCPDEQPVKAYTSRHGESRGVFYVPGTPQYDRIRPEQCFATEREARDAGYRAGRDERSVPREGRDRR
jgi:hypothetical protein